MDSRFPTYYLNDRRVLRLPPEHFRLFVLANAWAVSNMTDGAVTREDLYLIPFADESGPDMLVQQGLWAPAPDGWVISDFLKIQTSAAKLEAALENRREADRVRQRRKREGDKPSDNQPSRDSHVTVEGKEEEEAEAEERLSTKAVPQERKASEEIRPAPNLSSSRLLRSFPDCSTPGCDGKLNQQAVDAGRDCCADCVWSGRAAS